MTQEPQTPDSTITHLPMSLPQGNDGGFCKTARLTAPRSKLTLGVFIFWGFVMGDATKAAGVSAIVAVIVSGGIAFFAAHTTSEPEGRKADAEFAKVALQILSVRQLTIKTQPRVRSPCACSRHLFLTTLCSRKFSKMDGSKTASQLSFPCALRSV
jgi:hypothetical protein